MNRARREAQGRRGEWLAAWFLRLKGWRILARRVKTPRGEIDLIARRGRVVAFVEVKWRVSAVERDLSLDAHRAGDDLRIDAVLLAPGRWPHHLANAWMG
jgi:putative endonuclease